MAKTRVQVVNRALKNLGVLPQGQTANNEDFQSVNELVDGIVEGLIQRDIYYLIDVDATPEEVYIPLGHILAWAAAPVFDMQDDVALAAFAEKAERDLQVMGSKRPDYQPLEIIAY